MPNSSSSPADLTETPDLIIRGRRVVTSEGERSAAIHVRGGRISAITAFDDSPMRRRHARCSRLRRDARHCRHPCSHQRTGPHGMGRFFDGHPSGGSRRNHHSDRDAAQQHSCDDDRGRLPRKTGSGSGKTLGGRWFLGRCRSRKCQRTSSAVGKRRFWVQMLSRAERRRGIRACH